MPISADIANRKLTQKWAACPPSYFHDKSSADCSVFFLLSNSVQVWNASGRGHSLDVHTLCPLNHFPLCPTFDPFRKATACWAVPSVTVRSALLPVMVVSGVGTFPSSPQTPAARVAFWCCFQTTKQISRRCLIGKVPLRWQCFEGCFIYIQFSCQYVFEQQAGARSVLLITKLKNPI